MGFEAAIATVQRLEGATVDVSLYVETAGIDLYLGGFGGTLSEGRGPAASFGDERGGARWIFSAEGDTHFSLDSAFFEGAEVLPVRQEPDVGPRDCRYVYWTLILRQAGTSIHVEVEVGDPDDPDPAPPAPDSL